MPGSVDPSRVSLLKKPRVSISVEDIRDVVNTWHSSATRPSASPLAANGRNKDQRVPWPLPQFYLRPPTDGGSAAGSTTSLRIPTPVSTPNPEPDLAHRGELDMAEKYNYDLSKAQLKASSRTSALLAGFAMVCLVELQYDDATPHHLLIILGVVTSLLVSVHLLALMMSTCILPYMEATGCTQDSPHLKLKFYIDLSWLFSTCIGLLLFLVEIGVIFYVKFDAVGYPVAGYITTAMLIPVVIVFVVFSYLIHKNRVSHSLGRFKDKVDTMKQFLDVEANLPKPAMSGNIRDI
ncbi:unnamed protein product [Caenorhabditis auriculariae]|uniref:Protein orai n=1 Tax=Caenorhabditis auriculariae TaxID=2777116 RepID=A0A8S1H0D5_9PELO|nr:unnamed protein product [Caenorhabditis auriculariae]